MKSLLLTVLFFACSFTGLHAQFTCGDIDFPFYQLCSGDSAIFTANYSGSDHVISYQWEFGNGQQSANSTPAVAYADSGKYIAKLKIITDSGCVDSVERQVYVHLKAAGFSIDGPGIITPSTPRPIVYKVSGGNLHPIPGHKWSCKQFTTNFSCVTCDSTIYTPDPTNLSDWICVTFDPIGPCAEVEFCMNVYFYPAGIKEDEGMQPRIYPNPSSGLYTLDPKVPETYSLRIVDQTGREIMFTKHVSQNGELVIELQEARPGIYFLEIKNRPESPATFTKLLRF